jgi:hypothetical protein
VRDKLWVSTEGGVRAFKSAGCDKGYSKEVGGYNIRKEEGRPSYALRLNLVW